MRIMVAAAMLVALTGCEKLEQKSTRKVEQKPALAAAPAAPAGKASLPARYQGEWSMQAEACGTDSDNRITVRGDSIRFFDSDAAIEAVEATGPDSFRVTAKVRDNTGEWLLQNEFILSQNDTRLALPGGQGQTPRFVRCPGGQA